MANGETKRSRADLYAAVLEVLIRYPEGGRITRLSYGVGIPVDRLRNVVEALVSFGLVRQLQDEEKVLYFTTPRGLEFLDTYWKMKGFLAIFEEKQGQPRSTKRKP